MKAFNLWVVRSSRGSAPRTGNDWHRRFPRSHAQVNVAPTSCLRVSRSSVKTVRNKKRREGYTTQARATEVLLDPHLATWVSKTCRLPHSRKNGGRLASIGERTPPQEQNIPTSTKMTLDSDGCAWTSTQDTDDLPKW